MKEKSARAKRVIIIGGGVSGLTSGIYLRLNGYETLILEKNATVGGACIGWERSGCYIDGCIHWLVGTKPGSLTNKLWTDTGALDESVEIYRQSDFHTFEFPDGKSFTVWSELARLEGELCSIAPEDRKMIRKLCRLIKRFTKIDAPVKKPADMMNIFELCKVGFTMAGDYYYISRTSRISCADYAKKFKSPYIRAWIEDFPAGYNLMSLLYMLAHVASADGGIPIGGSREMAERMKRKYLSLGGELRTSAEVLRVNIEDGRAVGVTLVGGESLPCDWVVCATPAEHALKTLLDGKYPVPKLDKRFPDTEKYPIYTYTTAVLKVSSDLSHEPLSRKVFLDAPVLLEKEHASIGFRNYAYDPTFKRPENTTVVEVTLAGDDAMYFWWKDRREAGEYKERKASLGKRLAKEYERLHPELSGKIEVIDVLTPLTYERYLNSRHGSFQGFVQTAKGGSLMQKGKIKGLSGFILSGQWLLYSGGLPPAAITGKFAAQRICKSDGIKFKD